MWWQALKYELILAYRRRGELVHPLIFFTLVCTLFPFGVGSDPQILAPLAAGILWVAALLATLLSMDLLFSQDFSDGALEQMELSVLPFYQLVMLKTLVHWLFAGLPLVLLTPLLGLLLHLPVTQVGVLMVSLALGTPTLSLIGSIGAALTVGLKRGGLLLSLLVLPLFIPALIFGATAPLAAARGEMPLAQFLWLAALLFLAATLAPLAASLALRMNINDD